MLEWVDLAERIVSNNLAPIFFFGVLLWMIWKAGSWLATNIVEPAAKCHISLLDSVREVNIKNSETQARQSVTLEQIATGQKSQHETLGQLAETQKVQTELLRNLLQEKRPHTK